mmetsp:Transcript_27810/g.81611  ORF Transcript_27810/g.81611 Transcript_27810/m.81611 type:complete len:228 (-) Transcript_27810:874-1557(-)
MSRLDPDPIVHSHPSVASSSSAAGGGSVIPGEEIAHPHLETEISAVHPDRIDEASLAPLSVAALPASEPSSFRLTPSFDGGRDPLRIAHPLGTVPRRAASVLPHPPFVGARKVRIPIGMIPRPGIVDVRSPICMSVMLRRTYPTLIFHPRRFGNAVEETVRLILGQSVSTLVEVGMEMSQRERRGAQSEGVQKDVSGTAEARTMKLSVPFVQILTHERIISPRASSQ